MEWNEAGIERLCTADRGEMEEETVRGNGNKRSPSPGLFFFPLEEKNKIIKPRFLCSPILTFGEWY